MLCFDIETTGLDAKKCRVTVVCVEDFVTGEKQCFEFARYPERFDDLRDSLGLVLDEARSLCGFNAVRFDIPFLVTALKYSNARRIEWSMKTSDILEHSRHIFKSTFSLNLLCQSNDIPVKISDGCQAIKMAANGEWDDLNEYCAMDVSILCDMYRKRLVKHPRNSRIMDLQDFCRKGIYAEQPDFVKYLGYLPEWDMPKRMGVKRCFSEIYQKSPHYFKEEHHKPTKTRHLEQRPLLVRELSDRMWTEDGMVYVDNMLSKAYYDFIEKNVEMANEVTNT